MLRYLFPIVVVQFQPLQQQQGLLIRPILGVFLQVQEENTLFDEKPSLSQEQDGQSRTKDGPWTCMTIMVYRWCLEMHGDTEAIDTVC